MSDRAADYSVFIPISMPSINEVLNDTKGHWSRYSSRKKKLTKGISLIMKTSIQGIEAPIDSCLVSIRFTWYVSTLRKDLDNIAFGKKYILDAAIMAGILPDDSAKHLAGGFIDIVRLIGDSNKEGVRVDFLLDKPLDENGKIIYFKDNGVRYKVLYVIHGKYRAFTWGWNDRDGLMNARQLNSIFVRFTKKCA